MKVIVEKPGAGDVTSLLAYHVEEARRLSPPEFSFALPVNALLGEDITFWTARNNGELLGFGALKELSESTGEVKSMRTAPHHLRKGVGAKILMAIINEAKTRNYIALYLETGVTDAYLAARALYEGYEFRPCEQFADYKPSGHNWFMRLNF